MIAGNIESVHSVVQGECQVADKSSPDRTVIKILDCRIINNILIVVKIKRGMERIGICNEADYCNEKDMKNGFMKGIFYRC